MTYCKPLHHLLLPGSYSINLFPPTEFQASPILKDKQAQPQALNLTSLKQYEVPSMGAFACPSKNFWFCSLTSGILKLKDYILFSLKPWHVTKEAYKFYVAFN